MSRKTAVIAAVVIFVAIGAIWFFRNPSPTIESEIEDGTSSTDITDRAADDVLPSEKQKDIGAQNEDPAVMNDQESASVESPSYTSATNVLGVIKQLPLGKPADLVAAFEAEPVDPSWAYPAETQILQTLDSKAVDQNIVLASREVSCRAQTCRALLTYANQASDRDALMKLGGPVSALAQDISRTASPVSGAIILHKGGFEGEPTTSEIFFTRSGHSGVMDFWRTPPSPPK